MKTFDDYIKSIKNLSDLSLDESEKAFDQILLQKIEDNKIIDFLTLLSKKGESVDEIFGAIKSIKKKAKIIKGFKHSFDTCGTGGDGAGTFNISTLTAIIVSCCGVRVAKHGNKAVSSKSGSADVLTELGVNINIDDKTVIKCLKELNLCFLFAPNFHPILRNVVDIRKKIGKRTIFNILGPLLNPVECKRQIIGVYEKKLLKKVAEVLIKMGVEKAWVIAGSRDTKDHSRSDMEDIHAEKFDDTYDELTTCGINYIAEVNKKKIKTFEIDPYGYEGYGGYSIITEFHSYGPSPVTKSSHIILEILRGDILGPPKTLVLLNCGAALVIADKVKNIKEGMDMAEKVINSGAALKKLNDLIKLTNN